MIVLVVSPDPEPGRLLSDLLVSDCLVVACAGPVQARAVPRSHPILALVIDGRASPDTVTLVAEIRSSGSLHPAAPIIFFANGTQDSAQIASLGARLMTRPVNLLKVVDLIRAAMSGEVASVRVDPPRPRGREAMASARCLTRLWCTRATGVLAVAGHSDGWALLSQGGPVGPDGTSAIRHGLLGYEVTIERCEVDEPGDRVSMAAMLWQAARDASLGQSVGSLIPVPNGLTNGATGLPLTAGTRRCLERLGGVTVERLARRERASLDEVAADLAALRWLGLIALRETSGPTVDVEVDSPSFPSAEVSEDAPTTTPSPDASGLVLSRLVADAIAAVSRGDWVRADELLTRAHRRVPENAVVTAHLGWARFQNPNLPVALRMQQGAELVELAVEIDPECALAWRYCGELAYSRGDLLEATRCFGVAIRLMTPGS